MLSFNTSLITLQDFYVRYCHRLNMFINRALNSFAFASGLYHLFFFFLISLFPSPPSLNKRLTSNPKESCDPKGRTQKCVATFLPEALRRTIYIQQHLPSLYGPVLGSKGKGTKPVLFWGKRKAEGIGLLDGSSNTCDWYSCELGMFLFTLCWQRADSSMLPGSFGISQCKGSSDLGHQILPLLL